MSVSAAPNPAFERVIRESFARQGIMAHLGARLLRIEAGAVEIELPFSDRVSQQHGYFHAGATGAIADSAAGYAGVSLMPAESSALSVEYKINMLAPAKGEKIVARGSVVRTGRTLSVTRAEVYAVEGGVETHCATMTQTLMRLPASEERPAG